jgi:hypothetical protein
MLTMAIADMTHGCGLSFHLAQSQKFKKVLSLARVCSSKYLPPSRNAIAGRSLDLNYEVHQKRIKDTLNKDADLCGLTFYGDGATVKKMPLINILAAGVHNPAAVLQIVNCSSHLETGGKKDGTYIANLFRPHLKTFEDFTANTADLVIFDGAANEQLAGDILEASYKRVSVIHGAEHVISLFFADVFKHIKEFKLLKKFNRQLYASFGTGSMHLPYSLFQKHSKMYNGNRGIGLIRAADTRMGGHVISMMRTLRLKVPLMSMLNSQEFLKSKTKVS